MRRREVILVAACTATGLAIGIWSRLYLERKIPGYWLLPTHAARKEARRLMP